MIREKTTMEAWKKTLSRVLRTGKDYIDENDRVCRECLNLKTEVIHIEEDTTDPFLYLQKLKEWELPELEEIREVMLSKRLASDYAYSYGPRAFNFQNMINQMDDYIIPLLKKNKHSRRAILSFWDPVQDSKAVKQEIPGLVMVYFKIQGEKLYVTCIVRSNDLFFGWPANMYQMSILQKYVMEKIGCKAGSITTLSTSAHIYHDQFPFIKKVLEKD